MPGLGDFLVALGVGHAVRVVVALLLGSFLNKLESFRERGVFRRRVELYAFGVNSSRLEQGAIRTRHQSAMLQRCCGSGL